MKQDADEWAEAPGGLQAWSLVGAVSEPWWSLSGALLEPCTSLEVALYRLPPGYQQALVALGWACFEKTDTEVVWHIANWFGVQSQPGTDTGGSCGGGAGYRSFR